MVFRIFIVLLSACICCICTDVFAQASNAASDRIALAYAPASNPSGSIKGTVQDAVSGETLAGVNVFLRNTQIGAASNIDGAFNIASIPTGEYVLEARMIGFEPYATTVTLSQDGEILRLTLQLKEEALPLSEIVVTPGRFAVNSMEAYSPQTFDQEDIQNVPQFGEDIYRAVTRLPGITASDFSSKFMIRGGEHDEVLVTLDGLELYDPFHMKDIGGGGLSIVDAGSIGGVDLLTGAFPAAYGNRLSGVFEITSAIPSPDRIKSSVGISFINTRVSSQGTLKNKRTSWMVVGRRGYLDILLGMIDENFSFIPQYYDIFGKVQHAFNQKHSVSLQWLTSGDKVTYQEILDPDDRALSTYGNTYLWTNWKAIWGPRLYSETTLSYGNIWRDREGVNIRNDDLIRFLAFDRRSFDITNVKQDWTFDVTPNYMLSWGVNVKHYMAQYDYESTRLNQTVPNPDEPLYVHTYYDEIDWDSTPSGIMSSLYAGHRFRVGSRVTAELGSRFEAASWTGDTYLDPRINIAYQAGEQTAIRAGWGHFHQVQGIEQLDVQDGDFNYYKAQRAEHMILGLEHMFTPNISLRLDFYHKVISNTRPRFISLEGDVTQFFPEVSPDRVQIHPEAGRSSGIEFLLRRDNSTLNWWASYSLSRAEEQLDGVFIPKSFDQRHTLHFDIHYRPAPKLHINMAWQYHSGWRYSDVLFDVSYIDQGETVVNTTYGPYNGQQFPAYHRMDFRISYDFSMKQHALATYLEVRNVYNRKNIRMLSYESTALSDGTISFVPEPEHWLPVLPAIGLRLDLNH